MAERMIEAETRRNRREHRNAALLLLLVVATAYFDVVFRGRSLIATNLSNPMDYRAGPENYGPNFVPHEEWTKRNLWPYANIRDAGATWWQWEPSVHFLKQAIADREWPFWNPYIAGGTPAMANLVPAFFFPPSAIVVLLGASPGVLNAYFLFLLWASAFFTYLFIRRHDVAFVPAVGGALAVLFSGMMQQHAGTFIGQTAACLPLVLYGTRVFLDTPDRRRAVLLAAIYAMAALASFPPLLVAIFGLTAVYVVVALVVEPGLRRQATAGWWLVSVALALGFVAFYYVPALALRAASPQAQALYRDAGLETMPLMNLYQLLSPTLMGGLQYYLQPVATAAGAYMPYAGMTAFGLALVASTCPKCKSRTLRIAAALSVILIALKLVGTPGVHLIGELPVLREIHIAQYFGIPVPFLIGCLAALGLDGIWKGRLRPARAILAAVTIVMLTESIWQIAEARRYFRSPFIEHWTQDWRVLAVITVVTGTAIVVAALARGDRRVRIVCVVALVATGLAEGTYDSWIPRPAAWDVFAHPPKHVRMIREADSQSRVFPAGALGANVNEAFRIASLGSLMAFNPPRVYELFMRYGAAPTGVFMREPTKLPPEPVLDRAAVGFISTNHWVPAIVNEARVRGYASRFDDGLIAVFSRTTQPRYFFSSEYALLPTSSALEAIAAPNAQEIVIEKEPGFPPAPNGAGDPEVKVVSSRLNSLVLEVDAPRQGLLYAADSYFEGWTATVNGTPTEIMPANYAFRAVVVPAGHSRVEFRYWPPGLTVGLFTSLASLIAVVALLAPSKRTAIADRISAPASEPRTMSAVP